MSTGKWVVQPRTVALIQILLWLSLGFSGGASAREWHINNEASALFFTVIADGVPFRGRFWTMEGQVRLDPDDLDNALIDVKVPLSSLDTQNADADTLARSESFFDLINWPYAHFVSERFSTSGRLLRVSGQLTLRGITHPITVDFRFREDAFGHKAMLIGKAGIGRLKYHIGLGEWENTAWLSDNVDVQFNVVLDPAP